MAINETIVTGRKFRKCIDAVNKTWQRISFWTKSSDVEFEDGKNAETKLGAIDGITDSLVDTSSRMAASAKAVSTLNNNLINKFAVLTGTTHTIAGQQTSQSYPDGFNQNNCIIVGVMIRLGTNWYFGNYNAGYTYINAQILLGGQVGVIPASGWTNCAYKIMLYKYA